MLGIIYIPLHKSACYFLFTDGFEKSRYLKKNPHILYLYSQVCAYFVLFLLVYTILLRGDFCSYTVDFF